MWVRATGESHSEIFSELVSWVDEEGCELGKELWVYPGEVSLCKLTVTRGLGIHIDQGEK